MIHDYSMYSTFSNIGESVKLVWKHKLLWILSSLIIGTGFGSGFSWSGITGSSNKDEFRNEKVGIVAGARDALTENVVPNRGVVTSPYYSDSKPQLPSDTSVYDDHINDNPARSIPSVISTVNSILAILPMLVISIVLFFFVIIALLLVKLLVVSWAKGAFYTGLIKACRGEEYGFRSLGDAGRMLWRKYLRLLIYLLYMRFLSLLPFFLVLVIYAVSGGSEERSFIPLWVYIILQVAAFVWMVVFNISLYFVEEYSLRLLVTDNLGVKEAYKTGWKYYKTRPGKSWKLVLAMIPIFLVIFGILFGIVILLVQSAEKLSEYQVSPPILALIGVPLYFGFMVFLFVFPVFLYNFVAFSFTNLFLFIREYFTQSVPQETTNFLGQPEVPTDGQV